MFSQFASQSIVNENQNSGWQTHDVVDVMLGKRKLSYDIDDNDDDDDEKQGT